MARLHWRAWRIVLPAIVGLIALFLVCGVFASTLGAVAGLLLGCCVLAVLYAIQIYYLGSLGNWLNHPSLSEIPDGFGVWAEVFARLHRWHRASEINQRRLIDNEERFRRTISALPDGIILVDAALQIEWCNPVAERHLSLSLRADQGLRLTNLVRDPHLVAYMTSGHFDAELVFRPLSNPSTVLSLAVIEFEPARSIVITRDITQTERLESMRRDFVANVSHELRTPLTVIKGFLESFADEGEELGPVRQHHLRLMDEQAERMHHLIEDLLMLSRLESESPNQEETVDIAQLIAEVADEARTLSAGRHRISVEVAPAWVRGSRDELRSAFGNLVSNAIRYTPEGGTIRIAWAPRPDGAAFQVIDSGIGIAPEHIPRLTERFYRVEKSRSRETGGTGLGLAIVKHVLLRHGGRLDIESELGRGSTFCAWLPSSRLVAREALPLSTAQV
ncbi:MAG TPA: phosphate regulon sensor histidine kinase PhoR [Burkholderiaceae bacterium]|nr:phosphate regulon sensor histidine kinase PhoR [Burkholderiaceae bacterium]